MSENPSNLIKLAAEIVAAYVANNSVRVSELPSVINSVHAALQGRIAPKQAEPEKPTPPVSIKKSITPDHIISLEDGRPYKSLKRHLHTRGLTPEQYREKWGLPKDYPMVAPNYAKQRSELARSMGLGRKAAAAKAVSAPKVVSAPVEAPKGKRRGRAKKVA